MNQPTRNGASVAVTGATGFLGSEIVARLLVRDRRTILCVVRADCAEAACRRGRDAVAGALGRPLTAREKSRMRFLRGDIETAYFGLAPTVHDSIAEGVEEIFHCAASTRLDRPLRDARWTNVRGVQTVHAFAAAAGARGRFQRLHHISSAYVVGRVTGPVFADAPPRTERRPGFRNTFEQTKAEAEDWLRSRPGVPTTIYRPSAIVGDSRSGRTTSWTAIHFAMNLMASDLLRLSPRVAQSRVDCVPGDFVADAILALGAREDSGGQTYHITAGRRALALHELAEFVRAGFARHSGGDIAANSGPGAVGRVRRRLRSLALALSVGRRRRALAQYAKCEPYTRVDCVFENDRERRLLAEAGVWLPAPDAYFPRTVDYAVRAHFGRSAERPYGMAAVLPFVPPRLRESLRWPEAS